MKMTGCSIFHGYNRPLFLALSIVVSYCLLTESVVHAKKKLTTRQPWEHHRYPHPIIPSISDLEESTTLEEIDRVLERVTGTDDGVIIQRYKPQPLWLWTRRHGTVIYNVFPRAIVNMIWAFGFCVFVRHRTHGDWNVWATITVPPDDASSHPLVERFAIADKVWSTLQQLTTFLLTFFVGQGYSFWRSFYGASRGIQGRLNDIQMLLASHAARSSSSDNRATNSYYTSQAHQFLQDNARRLRLYHLLFWASNTSRFRVLLTNKGMGRMVDKGILTENERQRLVNLIDLPPAQRQYAVLEEAIRESQLAIRDENVMGIQTGSLERMVLTEFCKLRGTCGSIPDMVDGRMPLAYAHFVQILVDTFVMCTPIAKYADLGIISVLMIGILTIFYHGLLSLAKVFLDPLDNEDFCEGCLYLDLAVLIRESNSASNRWIKGAACM